MHHCAVMCAVEERWIVAGKGCASVIESYLNLNYHMFRIFSEFPKLS